MEKGFHHSIESRQKMRKAHLGMKFSEETKKKMSLIKKGKVPKNIKQIAGWNKGLKLSKETRDKISKSNLGRIVSSLTRKKLSKARLGYKFSEETKRKIANTLRGRPRLWARGEGGSNWQGGITPINNKVRDSMEYRKWVYEVFKRDDFTCQKTKVRGCKLVAHHIKNFSKYPELRFVISNGITLSVESHKLFHYIYGKKNNTRKQLLEFIN